MIKNENKDRKAQHQLILLCFWAEQTLMMLRKGPRYFTADLTETPPQLLALCENNRGRNTRTWVLACPSGDLDVLYKRHSNIRQRLNSGHPRQGRTGRFNHLKGKSRARGRPIRGRHMPATNLIMHEPKSIFLFIHPHFQHPMGALLTEPAHPPSLTIAILPCPNITNQSWILATLSSEVLKIMNIKLIIIHSPTFHYKFNKIRIS